MQQEGCGVGWIVLRNQGFIIVCWELIESEFSLSPLYLLITSMSKAHMVNFTNDGSINWDYRKWVSCEALLVLRLHSQPVSYSPN